MRPVLRLYYMPRTRSSRVLWLLSEIDAPCELVKLAPEQRQSVEHLARHPLGRVPALELDDGTVVFESAAICLQLADLHPRPEHDRQRRDVRQLERDVAGEARIHETRG